MENMTEANIMAFNNDQNEEHVIAGGWSGTVVDFLRTLEHVPGINKLHFLIYGNRLSEENARRFSLWGVKATLKRFPLPSIMEFSAKLLESRITGTQITPEVIEDFRQNTLVDKLEQATQLLIPSTDTWRHFYDRIAPWRAIAAAFENDGTSPWDMCLALGHSGLVSWDDLCEGLAVTLEEGEYDELCSPR